MTRIAIDRDSPVPFYFQLAGALRDEITSGRWPVGHRLMSEPALCEEYGVSRSVIRQALDRLERDGHVQRIKGRGTFVTTPTPPSWQLQSSAGFFQDEVGRLGRRVRSKILRAERIVLPPWAVASLELEEDAEGVVLERLRSVDGRIALCTLNYLPLELADTVLRLKPRDSLYERIQRDHGLVIEGARRVVEAVAAPERLARLLEVPRRSPLAYIESVSWDASNRPFDCFQAWLRTDAMPVEVEVSARR